MICYSLPPNGNSVSLPRLLGRQGRNTASRSFAAVMAARCGVPADRLLLASSGSSALYVALMGLAALDPSRRAVAVPAWCCPSVPQAVLLAGLEPVLVDLDPSTIGYDTAALRRARERGLLAVILVHFFGLQQPLPQGDWTGTAFLRDCAQDFDHRPADGLPCVFSFGRGKAINTGHGGALCIPEGGSLLRACVRVLASLAEAEADPRPMAVAINLLSHPRLYWALSRLPGLGLGRTEWHPLDPKRVSPAFDGVALASLEAYASCRGFYRRLIRSYRSVFDGCDGDWISAPGAGEYAMDGMDRLPARFPVFVRDPGLREILARELGSRFGGVTRMYPSVLGELPGAPEGLSAGTGFPGARRIAREILTLPVTAEMRKVEGPFFACLAGILDRAGVLRRGTVSGPEWTRGRRLTEAEEESQVSGMAGASGKTAGNRRKEDWNALPGPVPKGEEVLALDRPDES